MHAPSQRNALITGGAVRIGREIALGLAHQGWNVAVHYRSSAREAEALVKDIRALGGKAALAQGDLGDPEAPEKIVEAARAELGALHCLINNASLFKKDALGDFTEAQLAAHFNIHAFAPLRLIRHFAAQCAKDADNCVINIGDSMRGWSMSSHFLTYALSKLTLMQMAPLLVGELAPHVRINTVAPGPTLPSRPEDAATFEKLKKAAPLQRLSAPRDVCDAVLYLLGAPSVTGQCVYLSGGAHLIVPNG